MFYRDSKVVYLLLSNYKPVNQPQWFKPRDCVINLLSVIIQLSVGELVLVTGVLKSCVNFVLRVKINSSRPPRSTAESLIRNLLGL